MPDPLDALPPVSAGPARRVGARVVDAVLVAWALVFVTVELEGRLFGGDFLAQRPLSAVSPSATTAAFTLVALVVLLDVLPVGLKGRSPGKLMTGTKVVDVADGQAPGVLRAVLRALLLWGWIAVPVVGWGLAAAIALTTLVSPHGRGLHDRICGTVVVISPHIPGPRRSPA